MRLPPANRHWPQRYWLDDAPKSGSPPRMPPRKGPRSLMRWAATAMWSKRIPGTIRSGRSPSASSPLAGHEGVTARSVGALPLRRIAIDQRAQIHRMGQAAHLVLDLEQFLAGLGVHDLGEPILERIALLADQPVGLEPVVRAGEVCHVDGHVVAVVGRQGRVGLAEDEALPAPE